MASHAGWVYVLKTKEGYIDSQGNKTTDINKARKIKCLEFGFSTAYETYYKMGFTDQSLSKDDIKYETVEPSYDSRLSEIEDCLMKLGKNWRNAAMLAEEAFLSNELHIYDNYKSYIAKLFSSVINYYISQPIDEVVKLNNQTLQLHEVKDQIVEKTEYKIQEFFHNNGLLYKYSFTLKNPHIEKYFDMDDKTISYYNNWQNEGIERYLKNIIELNKEKIDFNYETSVELIKTNNDQLEVYFTKYNSKVIELINNSIRNFYNEKQMHITRMFGSYILLQQESGKLKAKHATPIPIKYCPLMIKLLKEVAGDYVDELLKTLQTKDIKLQEECMCKLINETVIKSGYFDTSRPLNSCEANVLFGASETMSSAFKNNLVDAAVIVSNNLGTIITTNESNTQGAVKRMTGLFYTTSSKEIVKTATESGILPVFPYSGKIDQLQGVKEAIKKGYKKIAVSVAANDNYLHEQLKQLETEEIKIYKFGLCSTGIDEKTAQVMKDNADVVWSCASKYVKELIEPNALAQVGVKIPVHIMTKDGWNIIKNHLTQMDENIETKNIKLQKGEEKPVFLNSEGKIKTLQKKYIKKCSDCPNPCI